MFFSIFDVLLLLQEDYQNFCIITIRSMKNFEHVSNKSKNNNRVKTAKVRMLTSLEISQIVLRGMIELFCLKLVCHV